MSISTFNEDIDLLTNRFTKSVPIKLSNNYETDFSTIENTLKVELLKAIQWQFISVIWCHYGFHKS